MTTEEDSGGVSDFDDLRRIAKKQQVAIVTASQVDHDRVLSYAPSNEERLRAAAAALLAQFNDISHDHATSGDVLEDLREPDRRRIFWRNVQRLQDALGPATRPPDPDPVSHAEARVLEARRLAQEVARDLRAMPIAHVGWSAGALAASVLARWVNLGLEEALVRIRALARSAAEAGAKEVP